MEAGERTRWGGSTNGKTSKKLRAYGEVVDGREDESPRDEVEQEGREGKKGGKESKDQPSDLNPSLARPSFFASVSSSCVREENSQA